MRVLPLLFLLWIFVPQVNASPKFTRCASVLRALEKPEHDTSVELELKNSEAILQLLTTKDGTLGPILPPTLPEESVLSALPVELRQVFHKKSYEELAATPWDSLTASQKRLFLYWVTKRKSTPFFDDRVVPGMKMKDEAILTFQNPTVFLGKSYDSGNHVIDISQLFRKVEYGSPAQNPDFLELHFRTNLPAGDVSQSAWVFLTGLNQAKIHQHVHVVTPLDITKLQTEGEVRSLMYTDFFRRANLALEMMKIVEERHHGISEVRSGDIIFFDNLDTKKLTRVFSHFEKTRKFGVQPRLGSETKMAYIGFRGADTYDNPSLIGFEVRAISQASNPEYIKQFLNSVQWTLQRENFGISGEDLKHWIAANKHSAEIDMSHLYYNKPWEELSDTELGRKFQEVDPYLRKYFFDLEQNRELKMLIHDWSKDPLLFTKPKLIEHIKKEQLKALQKLNSGEESPWTIVRDFLKHSGLYGIFTRSIGN